MTKYDVKFYFVYPLRNNGAVEWEHTSEIISLSEDDSLRDCAIGIISKTKDKEIETDYLNSFSEDSPISFSLLIENSSIEKYLENVDLFSSNNLKYDLDSSDRVKFIKIPSPAFNYDWKYGKLLKMYEMGFLSENPKSIIIQLQGGLGGGAYEPIIDTLIDWIGSGVVGSVAYSILGIFSARIKSLFRTRKLKNIAKDWKGRGIDDIKRLREFIDTKKEWHSFELKKQLGLNEKGVRKLMKSVGYIRTNKIWVLGIDSKSKKLRSKWIDREQG